MATAVAVGATDKLGSLLGKGKADKPQPTLEFATGEVVAPMVTSMPALVEFSGPLVAPGTAINAIISIETPDPATDGFRLTVCYRQADSRLRCAIGAFK